MDKNITYNSAIEEIESILAEIENEIVDIDIVTEKVKRVSELLTFCKTKLRTTEEEVEKVLRSIE
jgi:exodeoxyribonuclease VII small subunit